jgi:hypothetical protein
LHSSARSRWWRRSLATETLRFDPTATLLAALAWSVLVMSMAAIVLLLMIRHGESRGLQPDIWCRRSPRSRRSFCSAKA